jgi:hypothetical protein
MIMSTTLALVCDIFTPILVLASFTLPWLVKNPIKKQFIICATVVELCVGLISTYGLMAIDNFYNLWPAAGLDYSTHTAFALTFCLPLVKHYHWAWGVVLLLYAWAMESLGYHSWADIFSSFFAWCLFTLSPLLPLVAFLKKRLLAPA